MLKPVKLDNSATVNAFSCGVHVKNYLRREVQKENLFIIKDFWDKPLKLQVTLQNDTNKFPQFVVRDD